MRLAGSLALVLACALAACQSSDVSRALGARCDTSHDCDQMCLGPGSSWPGGFCTTTCVTDDDCGAGAACVTTNGGVCTFTCTGDGDCAFLGSGYTCQGIDRENGGNKVMVCAGA